MSPYVHNLTEVLAQFELEPWVHTIPAIKQIRATYSKIIAY